MSLKHGLAACLAAMVLSSVAAAQNTQAGGDAKELDQRVYKVLREVINAGADLYNRPVNDHNGCYRLYQGSLMTLKPLLDHRPRLQKVIDDALAAAGRESSAAERAFILRGAIDRIRDETGGKATAGKKGTLWDRLGGEKNVRKVVDDFVGLAATDPKVDFFRGGKHKLNEEQVADLKQKLVEFVSQAAGGPLKYTGRDMKTVHKGMGITDAQFGAAAADLKQALDKSGAKPADRDAVLEAVGKTRKDIVEKATGGKPETKKDGEKPIKKDGKDTNKEAKKPAEAAIVSGKVTYKGQPLPMGTITFHSADGHATSTAIQEDGTYSSKVAPGAYKIAVKTEKPKPAKDKPKDKGADKPGKFVMIPKKYADPKTSSLAFEVKNGKQAFDIDLQD